MIYVGIILFLLIVGDLTLQYYNKWKKNKLSINIKETLEKVGYPLITIENNGYDAYFLIDTGANSNIINSRVIGDFSYTPVEETGSLLGAEGTRQPGKFVKFDFKFKNKYNMTDTFLVTDIKGLDVMFNDTEFTVIGVLGIPFLERFGCIVDFNDLVIYPNYNKTLEYDLLCKQAKNN